MKKNKKVLSVVAISLAIIVLTLITIAFLTNMKNKKAEQVEKERIESIAQSKVDLYNDYIDSVEGFIDSKDNLVGNAMEVVGLSRSAIRDVDNTLSKEIFEQEEKGIEQTEKGNENLEKLKKVAIKNTNEYLEYILSNDEASDEHYQLLSYYTKDSMVDENKVLHKFIYDYITDENKALLVEADKREQKAIAERKAEWKAEHGISWDEARAQAENTLKSSVQTGMSGSEVRRILGSPSKTFKNDEAEFWTYDDMVLTMKNGFVFDITRN